MNNEMKFLDPLSFSIYEKPSLKLNIIFYSIILLLVLFLTWITIFEIDERVKGNGKVIPSSRIQTLQSTDGGTISNILVKEGEFVKKGQELVVLDKTRFTASVEELKQELYSLEIKKKRLSTQLEIKNLDIIKPLLLNEEKYNNNAKHYITLEKELYSNISKQLNTTITVLKNKLKQKKQESDEIRNQINQLSQTLIHINKELKIVKEGVETGAVSKIDLIKLQKEKTKITGDLLGARLALKRSKVAILEAKNLIKKELGNFKSETSEKLVKVEELIQKVRAKLLSSSDKLNKTVLYSPVSGIINQIYFTTIGGVVKPADSIMQIVPAGDSLLVEAKIKPRDIGFISPKNKVVVKISAYDFSIYGGLIGKIEKISPDSIFDEETKKYYYNILIRTDKNFLGSESKPLPIIPGMVSDIDVLTGKKTILDYLLKPIIKTLNNALTEK